MPSEAHLYSCSYCFVLSECRQLPPDLPSPGERPGEPHGETIRRGTKVPLLTAAVYVCSLRPGNATTPVAQVSPAEEPPSHPAES